jgi:hypothetical protein
MDMLYLYCRRISTLFSLFCLVSVVSFSQKARFLKVIFYLVGGLGYEGGRRRV